MKKQISKCVKMLFLGIIMCLGMALSVHAEGSGQFFPVRTAKSGTRKDFPGQTVRGRSGMPMNMEQMEKLFISAVDRATVYGTAGSKSYVYKDGVAKKVIGIGKYFPDSEYDYTWDRFSCFYYDGKYGNGYAV